MINTLSLFENRDYHTPLWTELNFFLIIFILLLWIACYLYAHYNIERESVQTLVTVDIRTGKSIPNSYF
jgi:hypothetical protein